MTRKIFAKLLEEATEVRGKKIRGPFWIIFGCVEDRIKIVRKGIRQFWGRDSQKNRLKKTHSVVRS
jgi:hypothetical protein